MQTLFLDGRDYATAADLHAALKRLLRLPAYYGGNADALYDCLSGRSHPVDLRIFAWGDGDVAAALRKCAAVAEDLGGNVKAL